MFWVEGSLFNRLHTSKPSIFGISMSSKMRSGGSSEPAICKDFSPLVATFLLKSDSNSLRMSTFSGVSSTIRIVSDFMWADYQFPFVLKLQRPHQNHTS